MGSEIVVIKCGGSTLDQLSDHFFGDLRQLIETGKHPVIVHGGGPAIKQMLDKLKVESEFIDGLRKTTKEVLEVVEMVLAGQINKQLVTKLQKFGIPAVGLSGVDGGIMQAEAIDYDRLGYVGDVKQVNNTLITDLINLGIVPVIAPIGMNEVGDRFNINADMAAGAIASSVGATSVLFVTDVPGILQDGRLISQLSITDVESLIVAKVIHGGMIPKVRSAIKALQHHIQDVMIVSGTKTSLFDGRKIIGTKITKGEPIMRMMESMEAIK